MKKKKVLSWCNKCKENSMTTKIYVTKDGEKKRVEYCINKGCGRRLDTTLPKEENNG